MRIYHLLGQGKCHFCGKYDTSVICHQIFTCCLLASHNICWAHLIEIQSMIIQGAFYWNYSVDSYSGIRITENTEYQFPKENIDVLTWQKLGRRDRGSLGTQFSRRNPKDRRKLPNEHDYRLFCIFQINRYSVYSINSAIGNWRITIPFILCILIPEIDLLRCPPCLHESEATKPKPNPRVSCVFTVWGDGSKFILNLLQACDYLC